MVAVLPRLRVNPLTRRTIISTKFEIPAGDYRSKVCVNLLTRRTLIFTLTHSNFCCCLCSVSISLLGEPSFSPCPSETSYLCGFADTFLHVYFYSLLFSAPFDPIFDLFWREKLIDTIFAFILYFPLILLLYLSMLICQVYLFNLYTMSWFTKIMK